MACWDEAVLEGLEGRSSVLLVPSTAGGVAVSMPDILERDLLTCADAPKRLLRNHAVSALEGTGYVFHEPCGKASRAASLGARYLPFESSKEREG